MYPWGQHFTFKHLQNKPVTTEDFLVAAHDRVSFLCLFLCVCVCLCWTTGENNFAYGLFFNFSAFTIKAAQMAKASRREAVESDQ